MFKQIFVSVCGAALLALSANAAFAGAITISEGDGQAGVVTHTADIDVLHFNFTGAEDFTLDGTFHIPFGNGTLQPGNQFFGLLERNGSISDYLSLSISDFGGVGPNDWLQGFALQFFSDPLPAGFAIDPNTVFAFEDGTMQLLPVNQGNLVDTVFQISVQSDLDVPEPSTLALIAMALLSMISLAMMRRRV